MHNNGWLAIKQIMKPYQARRQMLFGVKLTVTKARFHPSYLHTASSEQRRPPQRESNPNR